MLHNDKSDFNEWLRDNPAGISAYLTENFAENDPERARTALNVVMLAQNVQILARDGGLRRDALYRTFGGRIDPQLSRVLKLLAAMNVRASIVPVLAGSDSIAAQLSEAFARDDPAEAILGLSEVVKSQNVSALALKLGIMRTTVYKTFGGAVDPTLNRVLNLFAALHVRLQVVTVKPKVRPPRPKLGRPKKVPERKVAKKKRPPENVERLDAEIEAYIRNYNALPAAEKIALGRASCLHTLLRWRKMMREDARGAYGSRGGFSPEFFRDRIRESQIRLLELRAWRATGLEPGRG